MIVKGVKNYMKKVCENCEHWSRVYSSDHRTFYMGTLPTCRGVCSKDPIEANGYSTKYKFENDTCTLWKSKDEMAAAHRSPKVHQENNRP